MPSITPSLRKDGVNHNMLVLLNNFRGGLLGRFDSNSRGRRQVEMIGKGLGWLLRHALLYILIFLALLFSFVAWPRLKSEWNGPKELNAQIASIKSQIAKNHAEISIINHVIPQIANLTSETNKKIAQEAANYLESTEQDLNNQIVKERQARDIIKADQRRADCRSPRRIGLP